jgi:hypothetical protein
VSAAWADAAAYGTRAITSLRMGVELVLEDGHPLFAAWGDAFGREVRWGRSRPV